MPRLPRPSSSWPAGRKLAQTAAEAAEAVLVVAVLAKLRAIRGSRAERGARLYAGFTPGPTMAQPSGFAPFTTVPLALSSPSKSS